MWRKVLLPVVVVAGGVALAAALVINRPAVEVVEPEVLPPLVRTVTARAASVRLDVRSQGTVRPRTEAVLVAEVPGRIVWTAKTFEVGGFFREGDTLVRLDDRDYELARASAEAQVAQARVRVARELAEAEVALEEWAELGEGEASPLVRREPQLQEARAALAAAEAALARAELDLERTRIRAPFEGRVRAKRSDLGQFVGRGTPVAEVHAVDTLEVRLPVRDEELQFIDVGLSFEDARPAGGAPVSLSALFAGSRHSWPARVVRTEGEVDLESRMVHLVAEVDHPYRRVDDASAGMPLAVGMFVDAVIEGVTIDGLVELPRAAMRGDRHVLIVDAEDRLRRREVALLRRERDAVVVRGGLADGERVCVSPLETFVEGMPVRAVEESPQGAGDERPGGGL